MDPEAVLRNPGVPDDVPTAIEDQMKAAVHASQWTTGCLWGILGRETSRINSLFLMTSLGVQQDFEWDLLQTKPK